MTNFDRHLDGLPKEGSAIFSTLRDIQPHPLSEDCWKIAVDWISTCTAQHERCSQAHNLPLPTRVIDVSGPRPRLIDGGSSSGLYTALSHCWGQLHRPLSYTTSYTLEDFRYGIDLLDLPATFRDAIEVTRRLKISYLWIDSLCIVQDLVEDWQREARLMGSYYQNCFLNISALDAPDSDTGFLKPRQTYPTVQLEGSYHMRPARRTWRNVFQDSPLSRRAWVLQERLVSTRVLHYGNDDMFWECLTCSTRESDTRQHRLTDQEAEWLDENFKRSLQYTRLEDIAGRAKAIRKWYKVVEQYTRLAMSHESDMLPAISGIAERIRQATGYDYVAGLWLEDIEQGLLWVADGPKSVPRIWRAPSWSWAQLTGPVHHLLGLRSARIPGKYDVKVHGVSLSGQDDNTLGDARLSVIGYTSLVWTKSSHGNPPYNNPSLKLIVDIYDQQGMPIGTGHLDTFMGGDTIRQCVALAISERLDPDISERPWLLFLLIEPVDGQINVYRRIGIGQELEPFCLTHFDGRRVFDQQAPIKIMLI
jgi:Heterokaryon incompatibility protein (HET)